MRLSGYDVDGGRYGNHVGAEFFDKVTLPPVARSMSTQRSSERTAGAMND